MSLIILFNDDDSFLSMLVMLCIVLPVCDVVLALCMVFLCGLCDDCFLMIMRFLI